MISKDKILREDVVQSPSAGTILVVALSVDNDVYSWEPPCRYASGKYVILDGYPSKNYYKDVRASKVDIPIEEAKEYLILKKDRNFDKMLEVMRGWDAEYVKRIFRAYAGNLALLAINIFSFNRDGRTDDIYKEVKDSREMEDVVDLLSTLFEKVCC